MHYFPSENLSYQPGDTFEVKITGLDQKVSYTVKFFSINSSAESDEKQKESKITAKNITKPSAPQHFPSMRKRMERKNDV